MRSQLLPKSALCYAGRTTRRRECPSANELLKAVTFEKKKAVARNCDCDFTIIADHLRKYQDGGKRAPRRKHGFKGALFRLAFPAALFRSVLKNSACESERDGEERERESLGIRHAIRKFRAAYERRRFLPLVRDSCRIVVKYGEDAYDTLVT